MNSGIIGCIENFMKASARYWCLKHEFIKLNTVRRFKSFDTMRKLQMCGNEIKEPSWFDKKESYNAWMYIVSEQ